MKLKNDMRVQRLVVIVGNRRNNMAEFGCSVTLFGDHNARFFGLW